MKTAAAAVIASLLLAGAAQGAETPASPVLMMKDLLAAPGKEVRVLSLTSAPGAASAAHRHNAQVFVYLLSGSMIMQVKGQPPVTLLPGQTFYEAPSDIHVVSRNASQTEPAKFLVFMILDKGAPVSAPAE